MKEDTVRSARTGILDGRGLVIQYIVFVEAVLNDQLMRLPFLLLLNYVLLCAISKQVHRLYSQYIIL